MHDDLLALAQDFGQAVPQFVWAFVAIIAVSYALTYWRWIADERYGLPDAIKTDSGDPCTIRMAGLQRKKNVPCILISLFFAPFLCVEKRFQIRFF